MQPVPYVHVIHISKTSIWEIDSADRYLSIIVEIIQEVQEKRREEGPILEGRRQKIKNKLLHQDNTLYFPT